MISKFEDSVQSQISNSILSNMMKFPKPRVLEENLYPDLNATQPELLHNLVHNFIRPPDNSPMDSYLKNTIQYLKDLQKSKGTVKINNYSVGPNLFFTNVTINQDSEVIPFLIDTGATNSLLHSSKIGRAHV